jgi:hypothetical protein
MLVKSKYKNPDRYIERLKIELEEAWESNRKNSNALGGRIWSGVHYPESLESDTFFTHLRERLDIRQRVLIEADIVKIEAHDENHNAIILKFQGLRKVIK